jgi:hypothetical protein
MYANIHENLLKDVLNEADEWSLKERANFNPFSEVLEEYIQSHKLILGEQTGIDIILGKKFSRGSLPYILYSDRAEDDGFNIADEMFDKIGYKYIQVMSQLDGTEIQVKIADRLIAKIIQLEEYKGINLSSLTDPKIYTGWFNRSLSCISIDVQLARIYRQLSSPAFVDKWEGLLSDEFELLNKMRTSGARECELNECGWENEYNDDDNDDENYIETTSGANENIKDKDAKILKLIEEYNAVIISKRYNKLQITNIDSDELFIGLKNIFGEERILKIMQYPKLPGDSRLRKYTYYLVESQDKKFPIIDLFNIDKYDPIPQKLGLVHPLVELRIILVDIWTIKLIREIKQIDERFANNRIADLYKVFFELRGELSSNELILDDLDILKKGFNYIGVMDKDQYAKSKIIRKNRFNNEIYFPFLGFSK